VYIQVKIGVRFHGCSPRRPKPQRHRLLRLVQFSARCARRHRFYDQALEPCGIRSTQFTILVGVAKTQPTSISALADVLVIDNTTLTRSLRLLKKQGLVSVSDRGAKASTISGSYPKGERTLAKSLPAWRAAQERFVQSLGADYWTNFRGELERLAHVAIALETATPR